MPIPTSLLTRSAIALCAALLLGLLLSYASMLRSGNAGTERTDFVSTYSAARLVVQGHGSQIYRLPALGSFERRLVRPLQVRDGVMPYLYPPYVALALAPIAALPYAPAYLLWLAINLIMLVLVLAALQRLLHLPGPSRLLFWLAGFSFLPVFVALAQGQTSIYLLAVFTAASLAALKGRDDVVGALLALGLVKAPYVLPFLIVLLARRQWRGLVAFGAAALILLGAPAILLGPSITTAYVHTLVAASGWRAQIGGFDAQLNHSIAGFAQLLLPSRLAGAASVCLSVAALVALARCARRSATADLPFALATVTGLLISPHVLVHDLSLLLLPVATTLRWRRQGPRHLAALLVAGYLAIVAGLRLAALVPLQLSVLAMAALGAWLYLTAMRSERQPDSIGSRHDPGPSFHQWWAQVRVPRGWYATVWEAVPGTSPHRGIPSWVPARPLLLGCTISPMILHSRWIRCRTAGEPETEQPAHIPAPRGPASNS